MNLTAQLLASSLDSTNLRLDALEQDIVGLCEEAAQHRFACVMIYPASIPLAAAVLKGTDLRIGTVIGFPSGRFSTEAKAAEIEAAEKAGAAEVDIVANYPALRAGRQDEVSRELKRLCAQAKQLGLLVKVIVETCYLNEAQKLAFLRICEEAGANFIKTSTGFGSAGAKLADIELWAKNRQSAIKLKASGGVKTLTEARAFLNAGAERLGTSSAGGILREFLGGPAQTGAAGSY